MGLPLRMAAQNEPVKESPAPTVSATVTFGVSWNEVSPGANTETLTAWVDNVKEEPLISQMPMKGKIVKETENKTLGYKELTLSNGARVILKKTDFKDDQVMMQAEAKGGMSLFGKADVMNLQATDAAVMYYHF